MTKLLLIRHGQSVANQENIFAGHLDKPLTDLGRRQAALAAEYIVTHYDVDAVYSSDLSRAFETGSAVAERLGMTVHPHRGLREICGGEWEGADYLSLPDTYPEEFSIWLHDIGRARCPSGESTAEVQARLVKTLRDIARDNEGKTVAVATHACAIRTVMCYCLKSDIADMCQVPWVGNASVTELLIEDGKMYVGESGIDVFLKELATHFGKGV